MNTSKKPGVKSSAMRAILERELERRGPRAQGAMNGGRVHERRWQASLADEIAASGLMGRHAAARRVWAILSGETRTVEMDVADRILTALDLSYLWHTELADEVTGPSCGSCGSDYDVQTPGCKRCSDRFSLRRKRANAVNSEREAA